MIEKTKRGNLVSKFINCTKNTLGENAEFWAPVALGIGVLSLVNTFVFKANTIPFWLNFSFALLLCILGCFLARKFYRDLKFWSRAGITGGATFLFSGIRTIESSKTTGITITVIAAFLILLSIIGIITYCLKNPQSQNS